MHEIVIGMNSYIFHPVELSVLISSGVIGVLLMFIGLFIVLSNIR